MIHPSQPCLPPFCTIPIFRHDQSRQLQQLKLHSVVANSQLNMWGIQLTQHKMGAASPCRKCAFHNYIKFRFKTAANSVWTDYRSNSNNSNLRTYIQVNVPITKVYSHSPEPRKSLCKLYKYRNGILFLWDIQLTLDW